MRKMHFLIAFLLLITLLLSPAMADDTTPPTLIVNVLAENGTIRVYGTATDTSGVDRVEVKIDDGGWKTADLSGNNFNYSENVTVTGYHVSGVRAFDVVGNPTVVDIKTFYAQKQSSSADGDISFFIRLSSVRLTSMNLSGNIREMEYPQDFAVECEIVNDDSVPHKLRYRVDINGNEEFIEDVSVSAGRSYNADERFAASLLSVGQNKIKISVIDWETKQVVKDRTITLNVKAIEKPVDPIKQEVVQNELNGAVSDVKISELERRISYLESIPPVEQKTEWVTVVAVIVIGVMVVVALLVIRTGKYDKYLKKSIEPEEEDFEDN